MNILKAEKRSKASFKRKHGMRVSGGSVKLLRAIIIKKAEQSKGKKK